MRHQIGAGSSVLMDCTFDCGRNLVIGRNTIVNGKCRLDNKGGITIGDNVSISHETIVLSADHDLDSSNFEGRNRAVVIEDYVWIGTRAMIMPGITIGRGAVVAAGAVVTRNVAPYDVVAGIPAKVIRKRNENFNYTLSYRRLLQ